MPEHPLWPRQMTPRLNMQKPRLILDVHTAQVFVTFDYKEYDDGRIEAMSRHDVTPDFMHLLIGLDGAVRGLGLV